MKNLFFYLNYLGFTLLLIGCADFHYQQGNKAFNRMAYQSAINHFEKSLNRRNNVETHRMLAESYRLANITRAAEVEYENLALSGEITPREMFGYAKVLMANGNYKEASNWLKKYRKYYPGDIISNVLLASCNSISSFKEDTTLYTLNLMTVPGLRTYYSPSEYKNGIILTADRDAKSRSKTYPWTGASYLDLYYTQQDTTGKWLNPELLKGEINGNFHEGPATFSSDGKIVYFTSSNYSKRTKLIVDSLRFSNLQICRAELENGEWTNVSYLPFNSDQYSCGHPSLSADGSTLYFVSDMPGGIGGTDIYLVRKTESGWTKPQNLGPVVNSRGNEMFPYIHKDGTLYFSSDGHNTLGGLDVFMTYFDGNVWHDPQNLNYPLNSSKDDFGFILSKSDETKGYVSSNRTESDKVYVFRKNEPVLILEGQVTVKGKNIPLKNAKIDLVLGQADIENSVFTDSMGYYSVRIRKETDYRIVVSKEGYLTVSSALSTKGQKVSKEYIRDFQLDEMILEKPIVLENIYYDYDKWNIRPDAAIELDKFVQTLNDNPKIRIELSSHADCRGSAEYNLVLTEKRARAAIEYVASRGIDPKRLEYKGYGETKPVNNCRCEPNNVGPGKDCTEEQHQQNRRTEFKIIEIRQPVTHVVQPLETLDSISKMYHVPIDRIQAYNHISGTEIKEGSTLVIE